MTVLIERHVSEAFVFEHLDLQLLVPPLTKVFTQETTYINFYCDGNGVFSSRLQDHELRLLELLVVHRSQGFPGLEVVYEPSVKCQGESRFAGLFVNKSEHRAIRSVLKSVQRPAFVDVDGLVPMQGDPDFEIKIAVCSTPDRMVITRDVYVQLDAYRFGLAGEEAKQTIAIFSRQVGRGHHLEVLEMCKES
jgi:hypothetical protein